jgi:NADH-quinone oxidoreductase subunit N
MLLARIIFGRRLSSALLALLGSGVALGFAISDAAWFCCGAGAGVREEVFGRLLLFDSFTTYFRAFLLAFSVLFVLFTWRSGIPDREDAVDFYTLSLGATLGMCLMASANHLLMVFLGIEMASVPSYVLAGILKGRRQCSEAALKFAVYGAGAAGVMLYGISLVAGLVGSVHIPTAAVNLADLMLLQPDSGELMVLALAGLMIMVGLAFKLSAVPFHFWAPDVFEGAAAEIGGFLSVASKAAALALLVRVALGLAYIPEKPPLAPHVKAVEPAAVSYRGHNRHDPAPLAPPSGASQSLGVQASGEQRKAADNSEVPSSGPLVKPTGAAHYVALRANLDPDQSDANAAQAQAANAPGANAAHAPDKGDSPSDSLAEDVALRQLRQAALAPVRTFIGYLIVLFSAMTCTFGNLAAYGQTNIKRLLAYSTIGHAGYMMMPVAAAVVLAGASSESAAQAVGAMSFYVATYLFMNLGAFMIVAFLRNQLRSEEIADYAGLLRRAPGVAICLCTILVSLVGMPPLVGFAAQFAACGALVDAELYTLLVIGGLNTVLSLFYYVRVIKVVTFEPAPDDAAAVRLPLFSSLAGHFVLVITAPVLILGVFWNGLYQWAVETARALLS